MVKDLIRLFLDGAVASILNIYVGGIITSFIPLPSIVSNAVSLGILVLIIDYVLKKFARLG